MPTFQCLYLLENLYLIIIEVKRLDVPEDAPASDKFFWLRVERQSGEIARLDFRSKDSAAQVQERYFEQGFLKFNAGMGTYIEKFNSAQHRLENKNPAQLDPTAAQLVEEYFLLLEQNA